MTDDAAIATPNAEAMTVRLSDPPWWTLPILASAVFACRLVWSESSDPARGWDLLLYPIGLAYVVLCCVCLPKARFVTGLIAGVVSAALFVGSIGLAFASTPLKVRFDLSRSAFEAVVAEADGHLPTRPPLKVILSTRKIHRTVDGAATVDEVSGGVFNFPTRCPRVIGSIRIAGCSAFWVENGHVYDFERSGHDSGNIIYDPSRARNVGCGTLRALGGPWFYWSCGC